MKKWAIEPSRIEVPQGDEVELVVTTTDVEHGIAIPGLDIREPVQPGRPTIVRFKARTAGTYPMSCSILCGTGHKQMTGVIVVTAAAPAASH
jgi:cytochrome c oxidase subunit 2